VVERSLDATIRAVVERTAMEKDRASASCPAKATARWSPVEFEPAGVGGDSLDSTQRCALEVFAEAVSPSVHLLAPTAGLGGAGHLVEDLAHVSGRTERAPAIEVERIVRGWQFCSGQKGGSKVGKTKRGKGTKWMVVVDGAGVPLGKHLDSASPAEVKLAEKTLAAIRVPTRGRPRQKPERMIGDKAYDSDPLRTRLRRRGIELIAPHKRNRVRPPTQDGRALRRYRRRWIVERTIAWLGNFRRLVVRWDRSATIYQAFFHIACLMIVLRRVVQ
jgi:transposase